MSAFWGMPTRGGKLTILNCFFWAGLMVTSQAGVKWADALVAIGAVLFSLPVELPCWIATGMPLSSRTIVLNCVMVGVNSILWGYGVSWVVSRILAQFESTPERRRRLGLCVTCGHDLRATPGRCPECGAIAAEEEGRSV